MCGIVGLFAKNPEVEANLGALLAPMLYEMSDRGPDSAGVAFYREPVAAGHTKLTLQQRQEYDRLQIRGVACSWCRLRMLQGEGEGVGDRRAAPHR